MLQPAQCFHVSNDSCNSLSGFSKRGVTSIVAKATIGGRARKRKRKFDNMIVNEAAPAKKAKDDGSFVGKSETKHPDYEKLKKIMIARYQEKGVKNNKNEKRERTKG